MTRRLTVILTEEQAERLTALASIYDCWSVDLAGELLIKAIQYCEDAIACDACEQIAWLAEVDPEGRA